MKLTLSYKVREIPNFDLDEEIQNALEGIGLNWIGRGLDLETGLRDIQFEFEGSEK